MTEFKYPNLTVATLNRKVSGNGHKSRHYMVSLCSYCNGAICLPVSKAFIR